MKFNGAGECLEIIDLGLISYSDFLTVQSDLLDKRINGLIEDTLVVAEHTPVVTLGRLSREEEVSDKDFFIDKNIPVIRTNRGGNATYHGPGQIVLYPVVDLADKQKDVSAYIDLLEKTICRSMECLGVAVSKNGQKRGVWFGEEKVSFIGVAFKKWVSFHGVSVNINNDITPFEHIDPCGEQGIKITSVKKILGMNMDMVKVKKILTEQFIKDLESSYVDEKVVTT